MPPCHLINIVPLAHIRSSSTRPNAHRKRPASQEQARTVAGTRATGSYLSLPCLQTPGRTYATRSDSPVRRGAMQLSESGAEAREPRDLKPGGSRPHRGIIHMPCRPPTPLGDPPESLTRCACERADTLECIPSDAIANPPIRSAGVSAPACFSRAPTNPSYHIGPPMASDVCRAYIQLTRRVRCGTMYVLARTGWFGQVNLLFKSNNVWSIRDV